MSTANPPKLAPLVAGERLGREEFHERYSAMPPNVRAELIDGVVYMPSPVGLPHGEYTLLAATWIGLYAIRTPGVKATDNASTALDDDSEVQPDLSLRILPECGGQTHRMGKILGGCPELIIEVSHSSKAVDLGAKLAAYERAGALEYVVLAIDPDEVIWHARREGRLVRIPLDADGLYRSTAFPGLWLDPAALIAEDGPALIAALERGLATREHADFVARLAANPRKPD